MVSHLSRSQKLYCALLIAIISFSSSVLGAMDSSSLSGTVTTKHGHPLSNVNVFIEGTNLGSVTNDEGVYKISSIPAGEHVVIALYVGRDSQSQLMSLQAGESRQLDFTLAVKPLILPGIVVTATQAGAQPTTLNKLSPNVVRRSPARATGELIRQIPGVESVRRGPVGLDPVVRGLSETEVGSYIDGSRMFPAGALRMDSPISHIDPNAIQNVEVVKGPYALTWGAGNLSAIRVETAKVPPVSGRPFNAIVTSGYHTNLNAADVSASVLGEQGRFSYWAGGTWREGNDYSAGDSDASVPGDFRSREVRTKLGLKLTTKSKLTISAGYQRQDDIDYPGRLLNADFFNSSNFALRWQRRAHKSALQEMEINVYANFVDHGMDNDGKPTAAAGMFPNGNPRPPLNIAVDSEISVVGGRLAGKLAAGAWRLESGADFYATNRDALRTISRRDNGMQIAQDRMWADAQLAVLGLFTQASHRVAGGMKLTATARVDFVSADADTANPFYLDEHDIDASESSLSAAIMLSKPVSEHWLVSIGAGSVARTADANERFSERIPASKAQTSAEFVGNPQLEPERSTQADLWVQATYRRFMLDVNGFARKIDNYITLQQINVAPKLPLSPPVVFGYINGDATFWGAEAALVYKLTNTLSLKGIAKYLWGQDDTLDEPALGISPFGLDASLRFASIDDRISLEATLHAVSEQDRVAVTRGEIASDGYVTIDLAASLQLWHGAELRAGILNINDKAYSNHLNARNPFTGQPVPEPGRVVYANVSYAFE